MQRYITHLYKKTFVVKNLFIYLCIVIGVGIAQFGYAQGTRSISDYEAWNGRKYPVFIDENNHLIIKFRNGTTKKLIDYKEQEKRSHPCRYRDGLRAAPGRNVCKYHIKRTGTVSHKGKDHD